MIANYSTAYTEPGGKFTAQAFFLKYKHRDIQTRRVTKIIAVLSLCQRRACRGLHRTDLRVHLSRQLLPRGWNIISALVCFRHFMNCLPSPLLSPLCPKPMFNPEKYCRIRQAQSSGGCKIRSLSSLHQSSGLNLVCAQPRDPAKKSPRVSFGILYLTKWTSSTPLLTDLLAWLNCSPAVCQYRDKKNLLNVRGRCTMM